MELREVSYKEYDTWQNGWCLLLTGGMMGEPTVVVARHDGTITSIPINRVQFMDDRITEIRQRCEKAYKKCLSFHTGTCSHEDIGVVAESLNDIPYLLAEIDRLTKEREKAKEIINTLLECLGGNQEIKKDADFIRIKDCVW